MPSPMHLVVDHSDSPTIRRLSALLPATVGPWSARTDAPCAWRWSGVVTPDDRPVLNGAAIPNRLTRLEAWHDAGLPALVVARCAVPGWIARSRAGHGGVDFDRRPHRPAYWTPHLPIRDEWRIHVACGIVVAAGRKVAPPSFTVPQATWVRSSRYGWRVDYEVGWPSEALIAVAKDALAAIRADCGAIDLGLQPDGSPILIEANLTPGLAEPRAKAYAEAVRRWRAAIGVE